MRPFAEPPPQPDLAIGPQDRELFAAHVRRGCKAAAAWAVGPEIELIGYDRATLERIGPETVDAIVASFASLDARFTFEDGRRIEAVMEWGWVTIEPGGQIEFSGARRANIAETEHDVRRFLEHLHGVAEDRGLAFLGCGFDPFRTAGEQRWISKRRYSVMRPYLSVDGRRGWDMMCRTAAIQVNLDYGSVTDLAAKFTVGNRLGPIVAAIFANSPFESGALSGFKSRRVAAWLETDTDRSGVSPAAIGGFTVDGFVDYALDVPMIFVRRDGEYVDLAGTSFHAFLESGVNGTRPRFADYTDHLTTIFTDARLKQHVEMRSADAGGVDDLLACEALWKGIAYDSSSLAEAERLAPNLDRGGFARLQGDVARRALGAETEGVCVLDVAREVVRLAVDGLRRVAPEELRYLDPLIERVIEAGECPADRLIREYSTSWGNDASKAVAALRVA